MKIPLRAAAVAVIPALLLGLGTSGAVAHPAAAASASARFASASASFAPASASFVSGRAGFVLGTRGCAKLPCSARLVKTADGGRTWASVPVPAVPLVSSYTTSPRSAVNTVRFADSRNGWLFGPGLWATHDGGRHWQRINLPGTVTAVAASGGVAFASVSPYAGGHSRLYQSPVGVSRWTVVPGVVPAGALAFYGHAGWAGVAPGLWATTDLRHWHKLSFSCSSYTFSNLAAATQTSIKVLCMGDGAAGSMGKMIYASANGGRTFSKVGPAPLLGTTGAIAMPPGRPQIVTLAAYSAASLLSRSVNGGRTWATTVQYNDGGIGWRDMAYATPTIGWLIHGSPGSFTPGGLMRTVNAGATWYNIAIP
jgi:hypothetical protein